jgi:hypothetical protein
MSSPPHKRLVRCLNQQYQHWQVVWPLHRWGIGHPHWAFNFPHLKLRFLPPPPALTHSTSLPVLHSAFNPHSSEAVLPIPPQVTLPAHHHRQSESTFPVHTPPLTITSQLASRQPRPLTITVPPIARSQSTPQLKRVYPPLELSTASVKRQKKEKK